MCNIRSFAQECHKVGQAIAESAHGSCMIQGQPSTPKRQDLTHMARHLAPATQRTIWLEWGWRDYEERKQRSAAEDAD